MTTETITNAFHDYCAKNELSLSDTQQQIALSFIHTFLIPGSKSQKFFTARQTGKTFLMKHIATFCNLYRPMDGFTPETESGGSKASSQKER